MAIKTAYILCAGKGTRMGIIGERLPKPLWPLFEKKMVDLIIAWLREIGITQIYMNIHHHAELFQDYFKNDKDIILLHEKKLLGSGGCLLNLKKKHAVNEKVFVVNSDYFYFIPTQTMISMMEIEHSLALFCHYVGNSTKYNKIKIDEKNSFSGVEREDKKSYDYTFSGMSIIDFSLFPQSLSVEEADFFSVLASLKKSVVCLKLAEESVSYDFGEKELYAQNVMKISNDFFKNKELAYFLTNSKMIKENQLKEKSYASTRVFVWNFSKNGEKTNFVEDKELEAKKAPLIILRRSQQKISSDIGPALIFDEVIDPINLNPAE
jgi:NDP-sugar pyrophosphorylase family protein